MARIGHLTLECNKMTIKNLPPLLIIFLFACGSAGTSPSPVVPPRPGMNGNKTDVKEITEMITCNDLLRGLEIPYAEWETPITNKGWEGTCTNRDQQPPRGAATSPSYVNCREITIIPKGGNRCGILRCTHYGTGSVQDEEIVRLVDQTYNLIDRATQKLINQEGDRFVGARDGGGCLVPRWHVNFTN